MHDEKRGHQQDTTYYPLKDSYELHETEIKSLLQSQASKSFSFFTVELMGGTRILARQSSGSEKRATELDDFLESQ